MHTYIHTYIRTYIHTCIHSYIHTSITYIDNTYIHTYIHICLDPGNYDLQCHYIAASDVGLAGGRGGEGASMSLRRQQVLSGVQSLPMQVLGRESQVVGPYGYLWGAPFKKPSSCESFVSISLYDLMESRMHRSVYQSPV